MERDVYIKFMLEQHLLVTKNYAQLTKEEAHNMREEFAFELTEILPIEHINDLLHQDKTFFERGYQCMNRIP